jgi:hypothetical protein
MKFKIGQELYASKGIGRWGELVSVKGKITSVQHSLTAGRIWYTLQTPSGGILDVDEKHLFDINQPDYEPEY